MARRKRILLIGINEADSELIGEHLSNCEYQIRTVDVNVFALAEVRVFQPHLVLLGNCPETFDTFELCKSIKQDSISLVLVLMSLNDVKDIKRSVESGTDDFLSLPVNREELRQRVKNLLKLRDVV